MFTARIGGAQGEKEHAPRCQPPFLPIATISKQIRPTWRGPGPTGPLWAGHSGNARVRGEADRITFRLQPGDRVQLVFHRGAKVKGNAATFVFEDVSGLIQWASSDRGVVTFESMDQVKRSAPKLRKLVQAWLKATA